ncbi:MAG: MerR family transcriptional regulator [Myxococcota bacterium]
MPTGSTHTGSSRSGARQRRASSKTARASRTTTSARGARAAAAEKPGPGVEFVDDGRLYYRIGEVSRITGVKPYVLRYWETEFRWMSPQKSRSKQRLYRAKDIETILLIKRLLYEERYTIAGARRRLRELGAARSGNGKPQAESDEPREQLGRVRKELQAIRDLLQESLPTRRR